MQRVTAIPSSFKRRIVSVWGEEGREWLDRLPALVSLFAERWELSLESPLPELSYGLVVPVTTADGTDAMLKLGVPNPELVTEIDALRTYRGGPVVDLLRADRDLGALLLRRLIPGTPLSALEDDEKATLIAARLIRDLPIPPPSDHAFPTADDWAQALDRYRVRFGEAAGPLPLPMVERAKSLFQELQGSPRPSLLLHGDLHHENILRDEEEGWLAVDPKGVVGDPVLEAARFQLNPIPRFLTVDRPRMVAEDRLKILSAVLKEDQMRLLAWAFFDAVLSACWSIENGGEYWRYFLSCAELFDKMRQGS
jgi:streptomycin 6-kinase